MIALNSPVQPDLKKLLPYLEQINKNGWYTNFGPIHEEFRDKLEAYLGVQNLLLVNNGTSALQVAGKTLNTQSIITTPFSFVATSSAFLWQGNNLAFADIDRDSYNLSPEALSAAFDNGCTADTIVATHVYGNPCDVVSFENIAKTKNKKVIYDAAHAFGIKIKNNSVLNYGDASILSFHATKVFHTVEGGAIVFKQAEDYEKAKELINFGIKAGKGIQSIGTNAKLNEYQAAVGLVNLENIDNILEHRAQLFDEYCKGLKGLVEIPLWHPEANMNGAYMPILLKDATEREYISQKLLENKIQSRHYFSPSLDSVFSAQDNFGTSNSQHISKRVLCLPLHNKLSLIDIQKTITTLNKAI